LFFKQRHFKNVQVINVEINDQTKGTIKTQNPKDRATKTRYFSILQQSSCYLVDNMLAYKIFKERHDRQASYNLHKQVYQISSSETANAIKQQVTN